LLKAEYNFNEKYEELFNCLDSVHYNTCIYLLEINYTFIVCRPLVVVFSFDFNFVVVVVVVAAAAAAAVVLLNFSLSG
jgi:hypothetical protein